MGPGGVSNGLSSQAADFLRRFDTDSDGRLTANELRKGVDGNAGTAKNGEISREEIHNFILSANSATGESKLTDSDVRLLEATLSGANDNVHLLTGNDPGIPTENRRGFRTTDFSPVEVHFGN